MFKFISFFMLMAVALAVSSSGVEADPPAFQHPNTDYMTWSLKDSKENAIDLTGYQSGKTFVVLFSASDTDSCKMMRTVACYLRNHPAHVGKVLAVCVDDTGHKALKQFIRQEEWTKRVAEWKAEQAVAKAAAEAANEEFNREEMSDFLKTILEELDDDDDLQALMDHHFPMNTACRCEAMWDWLVERMDAPAKAPRILKFKANGVEKNEWTTLPVALGG